MALVGTIAIAMTTSTQALQKGLNDARSSLAGFGKSVMSLKGLIAGSFAGAGIAALGHFAGLADDLSDNIERMEVMFGSASSSIVAQAEKMNTAFGTSEITFTAMATKMGGLFKSLGVKGGPAAQMTNQLLVMGQAIANFKGISLEQAMGKLQAGMAGKGKGLKEFGMDVKASMSVQERFNAIMSGGAGILGTMDQRAMDAGASWASFRGRVEELEISLGKNLPEMVEPFFAELNVLVVAAGDAFKSLKGETLDWGEATLTSAKSAAEGMGWVQQSLGLVANAWQVVSAGFQQLQVWVLQAQAGAVDAINAVATFVSSIPKMFVDAFNSVLDYLQSWANSVAGFLDPVLRPIRDLIHGKVGTEAGKGTLEQFKLTAPAAGGTNEFMQVFGDNLHDAADKALDELQKQWAKPWSSEGINTAFDAAKKKIQDARAEVTKGAMGAAGVNAAKAKVDKPAKIASEALAVGSKEAASAMTRSMFELGDDKAMKKVAVNSDKTVNLLQGIKDNLEAGNGEAEMMDDF